MSWKILGRKVLQAEGIAHTMAEGKAIRDILGLQQEVSLTEAESVMRE